MPTRSRDFGQLLRRNRVAAGLTQEELAERSGLSARGLSDLERGLRQWPHADTVRRLGKALGLNRDERLRFVDAAVAQSHVQVQDANSAQEQSGSLLPVALTTLIGREREVLEIRELLGSARLLSLVGTGGVGKTRLALEVARSTTLGNVYLVELSPVAEPSLVGRCVARVLDIVERPDQALVKTLAEQIGNKQLLLVLDNCEHLIQACAEVAETLLRACPRLRIMSTSREPLAVSGELVWRVPSLSLPPASPNISIEDATRSEAVRLFVQRANQSRFGFAITSANAASIAQVCVRLDGMPLAIELAAARVNALSVHQIASRLGDCLGLLTNGSRTAVDRQRTLRATLDWSYELLVEAERVLLGRLSV